MSGTVTNEQLLSKLDLILEKQDHFEQNLALLDKRFERLEGRFERLEDRFERLEDRFNHLERRVVRLEDKIDQVRISWSTRLVGFILGTSAVTSGIVAVFLIKLVN